MGTESDAPEDAKPWLDDLLVHRLTRPGRRSALNRLWEYLAAKQPNDALVGMYVRCLEDAGVTATE